MRLLRREGGMLEGSGAPMVRLLRTASVLSG